MPYAANAKISTIAFDGAIEISDEQYSIAIDAMLDGKIISIENGFEILDQPEPAPEPETEPAPEPEPEPLPQPEPMPISELINNERARRLKMDFEFNGKMFQRDALSLSRITGAATLAGFAVFSGAQPGDFRWSDPDKDFEWIAADNTVVKMDAQTCFAFGQAAARRETEIVFHAKALREMQPIPENFTDNVWWP